MTIEKDFFRQVMGHFTTGVTVVTTNSHGTLGGLTVNAFCSVSLTPPLILICVDLTSNTLPLIRESQIFVVNMLTNQQEELSRCFATHSQERFECFCHAPYHIAVTGAPVLDDALAFIDARVVAEYPGGDHTIFVGQIEALGYAGKVLFADETGRVGSTLPEKEEMPTDEEKAPLVYYRGQYRHLTSVYRKPSLPTYDETHTRSRS